MKSIGLRVDSVFGNQEQAAEQLKEIKEKKQRLNSFIHDKIIHFFLGFADCKENSELQNTLISHVTNFIQSKKNKDQWIESMEQCLDNLGTKQFAQEIKELIAFLAPFHEQIKFSNKNSNFIRCLNSSAPRLVPGKEEHIQASQIGQKDWLELLKAVQLQNSCLDITCRGDFCGEPYAFVLDNIESEKPDTYQSVRTEESPEKTSFFRSSHYSSCTSSTIREPTPEVNAENCACGADHSSTQSNVDQTNNASSDPTSLGKKTSQSSSLGSPSNRPTKPTSSGSSGGNNGSGGGSHSCGDPDCNIDHGKKIETTELPHNPNACTDENCTIDHNSSPKSPAQSIKKNATWAWGIFAACALGLIALIVNGIMNKKDESEVSIDLNKISSDNQTQSSINSIQSIIAKQKSLTSPSQQIARKTNSKIIPISSSSSRSPRVNSQAVTQTKNSQKNSQDPNPQNQAA